MNDLDRPFGGRLQPTETFPVVQRTGIKFFRRITRTFIGFFHSVGARGYFLRDMGRALGDPATFIPETIRQMKRVGVESIPLTVIVAAFIGGVIAIPVTCLVIALFGAPLATSTQRGGTAYGIGVSLATTIIFLLMIQLTKAIGGKALINPDLAAWLPNSLFAVMGLVLLARVRT